MNDTPLEICDAVFREHNKSLRVKAIELSARHIPRSQRPFICNQIRIDLGRGYDVSYTSRHFRIVTLPLHRAVT